MDEYAGVLVLMGALTVVGVTVVVVVSITTHEAFHGFVAERLGDPSARQAGRLTLSPIPHIDPFLTILLPLLLIFSGSGVIFGGPKPRQKADEVAEMNRLQDASPREARRLPGARGRECRSFAAGNPSWTLTFWHAVCV